MSARQCPPIQSTQIFGRTYSGAAGELVHTPAEKASGKEGMCEEHGAWISEVVWELSFLTESFIRRSHEGLDFGVDSREWRSHLAQHINMNIGSCSELERSDTAPNSLCCLKSSPRNVEGGGFTGAEFPTRRAQVRLWS
jgi:hypothetical protein